MSHASMGNAAAGTGRAALEHAPKRAWMIVAALLGVQAFLAFGSITADSRTFDETSHFISGISYWTRNDFRFDPENPPLVNLWATLPLRFVELPALPFASRAWTQADQWGFAEEWFAQCDPVDRWLWPARAIMSLVLIGLSLTVYGAAREAVGETGALASLACVCFWPTLIAHGRLVTSDIPLGLFATLAVWTAYRAFARPGWMRWVLATAALAALLLTKFSALLVLPAWALAAVLGGLAWRAARPAPGGAARAIGGPVARAVSMAAIAYLAIWASYGFRYSIYADDVADLRTIADPQDARLAQRIFWQQILNYAAQERGAVIVPEFVAFCEARKLLPEAYLYGFTYMYHMAHARPAYALGRYGDRGWWWYFPAAFALKTPIGSLILIALGLVAIAAGKARDWRIVASMVAMVVIYAATAIGGSINIGERHLAPIYPALAILAGAGAQRWHRGAGRFVWIGCLAWSGLSAIAAFPNFIPYFHEPARIGMSSAEIPWLVDSNVDWGQDLHRLRRFVAERGDGKPVKLAYFGSADPRLYVDCEPLIGHIERRPLARLEAGLFVVSPTVLSGAYHPALRPGYWSDEANRRRLRPSSAEVDERRSLQERRVELLLSRLRGRAADARVGALLVYRLSDAEVESLSSLDGPYP
ncbi:MAG: glycosyltransferase family 39 protein [Phycisphaerae bacterium]|nr:glycosyltransferase family 39 protein [Phycisphaerae bacterium]